MNAKMNVLASPISDAVHTNPIIFLLSGPNFLAFRFSLLQFLLKRTALFIRKAHAARRS